LSAIQSGIAAAVENIYGRGVCFSILHKALLDTNPFPRMNKMNVPDNNIFDHIDTFQQSLLGRSVLSYLPENTASQKDLASVFIVKSILDGLEDGEQCSETIQPVWFRRIWKGIVRRIATNSRTTHWAAEIRGDLYETSRDKTYRLPWQWKATIKITTKENREKNPPRKVVERFHVGTTALSNYEIARRSIRITNSGRGISANRF
jgi:hypothetical protein